MHLSLSLSLPPKGDMRVSDRVRRKRRGEEKGEVIRFKNSFFWYFYMAVTWQRPRF
jgi:hypothetical protein